VADPPGRPSGFSDCVLRGKALYDETQMRIVERNYVAKNELRRLQYFGMKEVREFGLKEEDVQHLNDEYRLRNDHGRE
jgi:hypothetical protein